MTPNHFPRLSAAAAALWRQPVLLLTLAVLFWSGNVVVGRASAGVLPPVTLAFWRWFIAFFLVLGLGWRHLRRDLPVLRAQWPIVLALSALGIASFNTLLYIGLRETTAINGLLLQSIMPLVILAAGLMLFGDRPGLRQLTGVAVSILGVLVIAVQGDRHRLAALSFNPGDIWVLTAVAGYALYSALLRKRPLVHPLSLLIALFGIASLMLLPLSLAEQARGARMPLTLPALAAIGYVALFPGLLSSLLYNRGIELRGAAFGGQFINLLPIFGSVLAMLFLGERLQGFHLIGALLIASGLALALMTSRKPAPIPVRQQTDAEPSPSPAPPTQTILRK